MPKEESAGAVLFYEKGGTIEYLLLRYDETGHWDFPKGHIEKGEDEIGTIKREVREETGIEDVEIIPGFQEQIAYFYRRSKNPFLGRRGKYVPRRYDHDVPGATFKTVSFYLARTKTKQVTLSREHTDCRWLSYEEARDRLTFENAKEILKKADSFLREPKESEPIL